MICQSNFQFSFIKLSNNKLSELKLELKSVNLQVVNFINCRLRQPAELEFLKTTEVQLLILGEQVIRRPGKSTSLIGQLIGENEFPAKADAVD